MSRLSLDIRSSDPDLVGPSLEAILCSLVSAERSYPQRARHGVGEVGGAAHNEACVLYGRQRLHTETADLTVCLKLPFPRQSCNLQERLQDNDRKNW